MMKQRIIENILVNPDTGCWNWQKGCFDSGYGALSVTKDGVERQVRAHRYAYEAFVGPIPAGLCVCHRCDVKNCCNPEHLFLGTNADNSRDMTEKGRQAFGNRVGSAKLNEKQVIEMRRLYAAGGVSQRMLADRFAMSPSAVSYIVGNRKLRYWKHLIEPSSYEGACAP